MSLRCVATSGGLGDIFTPSREKNWTPLKFFLTKNFNPPPPLEKFLMLNEICNLYPTYFIFKLFSGVAREEKAGSENPKNPIERGEKTYLHLCIHLLYIKMHSILQCKLSKMFSRLHIIEAFFYHFNLLQRWLLSSFSCLLFTIHLEFL